MYSEPRILKATHNSNFISEFETNIDTQEIIDYYRFISEKGLTMRRYCNKTGADDTQLFVHELPNEFFHDSLTKYRYQEWNRVTDLAMEEYCKKYEILGGRMFQHTMCKIQRTQPGQGYHQWHFESTTSTPYRRMVTMLYLNDGFGGGETEFLYQKCRIEPKAGKFVIFPCDWAWAHRGNPPLNGDKYIVTAWVEEFPNPQMQ